KKQMAFLAFVLFSIILVGLYYLVTRGPATREAALALSYPAWVVFAYASGLTMIFLPCTLPLAFVIVPMAMGEDRKKGVIMALLFGAGLTVMITIYTTVFAVLGSAFGFSRAAQVALLFGGIIAFVFGLEQLGVLPFSLPEYGGSYPEWVTEHGDYLKSFLLGLFLGNAGIGCPNPLFWWMSVFVAASGSTVFGASLGLIHGIGRAIPLIFLSVLGMLGVDALSSLSNKQSMVETVSGLFLIPVAAFITTFGLFGMPWWEQSFVHRGWNRVIAATPIPAEAGALGLKVDQRWSGIGGDAGILLARIVFVSMIVLPLLWWYWNRDRGGEESA
ncbi:MAG: cytochrome c biogenesis protein CcdA, partial [Candidatus Nanohaloarchaea archaeon]|nr:cytochrome c biogenesis protein CcdA [Candidatus Nanohaloarchaea archaeon]